jgi:predicted aconitase
MIQIKDDTSFNVSRKIFVSVYNHLYSNTDREIETFRESGMRVIPDICTVVNRILRQGLKEVGNDQDKK